MAAVVRFVTCVALFSAVSSATVSLEELNYKLCVGETAELAMCKTVGASGLIWLFSGQTDILFQASSSLTVNSTETRTNSAIGGNFTFTLTIFDNVTDTYASTAAVSNIQQSDNGTRITCSEPNPVNPATVIVIVNGSECQSPGPSSTIIIAPSASQDILVIPTSSILLTEVISPSPTNSPPPMMGGVNVAVAVAIPIVVLVVVAIGVVVAVVLAVFFWRRGHTGGHKMKDVVSLSTLERNDNGSSQSDEDKKPAAVKSPAPTQPTENEPYSRNVPESDPTTAYEGKIFEEAMADLEMDDYN